MLTASVLGLRYCRLLTDHLTEEEGKQLAAEFDYSFAVCYETCKALSFETVQKNACLIDLTKGVEFVLSKFNPTHRSQVRKSERINGLAFSFENLPFEHYFAFHSQCEADRGWLPVPEEELKNSICISATYQGQWIAGMSCYTHGQKMRIGRIYSAKRSLQFGSLTNNIYGSASKRIVFEYCRWGCENGYEKLDLGGVDINDPTKVGITEFKLHFGATIQPITIARFANTRFREQESLIRKAGYDIT